MCFVTFLLLSMCYKATEAGCSWTLDSGCLNKSSGNMINMISHYYISSIAIVRTPLSVSDKYIHNLQCNWALQCNYNDVRIVTIYNQLHPGLDIVAKNNCSGYGDTFTITLVHDNNTIEDSGTYCNLAPQYLTVSTHHSRRANLTLETDEKDALTAGWWLYAYDRPPLPNQRRRRSSRNPREEDLVLEPSTVGKAQLERMLTDVIVNNNARSYCDKPWARPYIESECESTCDAIQS